MAAAHPVSWQRVTIALLALAIYGVGASAVVHRAGASYRASLARVATAPPPTVAVLPDRPTNEAARPSFWKEASAVPPKPAIAPPVSAKPSIAEPAPEVAKKEVEPKPPALAIDPVWNDPRVKKQWDIDHLTIDQERELGDALKLLILTFNAESTSKTKLVGNRTSADRVSKLASELLATIPRKRPEVHYEFVILDSMEPNAFSIPGGTIFVSEGLLLLIGEDEPHVLQFVLAHEIAHVDEQHALQCLHFDKLWELRTTMGTAENLYLNVLPRSYYDGHEFEADRVAATALGRMHYGRYEKLGFLRKLQHYAQEKGFERGHERPEVNAERSLVDNHLRAHVSVLTRLEKIKEWIDAKPLSAAPKK